MSQNMFADAKHFRALLGEVVGAGSGCWIGGTGDAEFDTETATKIVDHAVERLREIAREMLSAMSDEVETKANE